MWYRKIIASTQWRSGTQESQDGAYITFYSPTYNSKDKNGKLKKYQEYPNIRIWFKKNIEWKEPHPDFKYINTSYETNVPKSEKDKILNSILEVLSKYPKGIFPLGTTIHVISKMTQTRSYLPSPVFGEQLSKNILIDYEYIENTLDHELGHLIDEFDAVEKKPPYKTAPTIYGKTNEFEAYAESYDILMLKGIDFRFPEDSQKNIDANKWLDYVSDILKKSNFKSNFQLQAPKKIGTLDDIDPKKDSARFSAIVGAFQNAIDKYQGNKNLYAKNLIKNNKKIQEIVKFVNNSMLFLNKPATQTEIDLAVNTIAQSIDKQNNSDIFISNGFLIEKNKTSEQNIDVGKFYLPEKIKKFIDEKIKFSRIKGTFNEEISNIVNSPNYYKYPRDKYETKYLENPKNIQQFFNPYVDLKKDHLKNLTQVSIFDRFVPVNKEEYELGQKIIRATSTENTTFFSDYNNLENITTSLIKQIFPNLNYKNPEDYLFRDFYIDNSLNFVLDTNSVNQKIINALNTNDFTKNLSPEKKNKLARDIGARIYRVRDYQADLLKKSVKFGDNFMNIMPSKYKTNMLTDLSLAKKAVDKLINSNIKIKGPYFMRIYNNTRMSERQKQELMTYFKSKIGNLK